MRLEYQILLALALDFLLGDPRWFPHPVCFIGRFAAGAENKCRSLFVNPKLAGCMTVVVVLAGTGLVTGAVLYGSHLLSPVLGTVCSILFLYFCLAAKGLADHSKDVWLALDRDDISAARTKVGMIVGRDTSELDQGGVTRACVESVAENTVDGVTAPLFWAIIAGPLGAILYKCVNTMDSAFGYKNEHYLHFGWAPARLDDLVNFIPARLTGLITVMAAYILGMRGGDAWRIFRRDRLRHSSPNAGQTEAAVAGALGIRLGGSGVYFGEKVKKPTLGDSVTKPTAEHIVQSNKILMMVTILFTVLLLILRVVVVEFFSFW